MEDKNNPSMRMTNLLLAGNLYTNHKIGKNLNNIGDNQRALHHSVTGLGKDLKQGISKLSSQINKTNSLLEKSNKISAAQLEVQTSMAIQQQQEYLEKKQNELVRDTFFNISQEYKRVNNNLSNDALNKHVHLCSIKACLEMNKIDSSIATSMEDKTLIADTIESLNKDIKSSFDCFNEKHTDSYNQMINILKKDEEKEITNKKEKLKKIRKTLSELEKPLGNIENLKKQAKEYLGFVKENLLYTIVILFPRDLNYRYSTKLKGIENTLFIEDDMKGILSTSIHEVTDEVTWHDNEKKYFRGNIVYKACYYNKCIERYKKFFNQDQRLYNIFKKFTSQLIEKNISILSNPDYLNIRNDLVFRCIDKKKYEDCKKQKIIESHAKHWWIAIKALKPEEILTPVNKTRLEVLFKIIKKSYELTENIIILEDKENISKINELNKEIEKIENKINKLREDINNEVIQAGNLYKDYPAMKKILTNR